MPKKLTYHPISPDDPQETTTHGHSFEAGKAVEVSDEAYAKLSANPWFRADKAAAAEAEASMHPSVGEGRPLDSSIDVQYPPGVGMKTHPDMVRTEEGFVPPDDAGEPRRGPGRPRKAP